MKPILLLALISTASAAERFPNTASDSALPKGDGFAARLKADAGAAAHPAVIFADNFEDGEFGARWDEKGSGKAGILSLVPAGAAECGKRCMKVEARLAENHGGGPTKWFEPSDTVFVRFYVRFDQNCDYVHHWRKTETLKANALALESYITDRWTKNPLNTVYFDNLIIARQYIGPAGR